MIPNMDFLFWILFVDWKTTLASGNCWSQEARVDQTISYCRLSLLYTHGVGCIYLIQVKKQATIRPTGVLSKTLES